MAEEKIVRSPNANVSENELTTIAEATTLIKAEITKGVSNGLSKEQIYKNIAQIIGKYANYFSKELEAQFRRAMSQMTIRDYTRLSMNSKTILQNFNNHVPGYNITTIGQLINLGNAKERGVATDRRTGQPTIPDYQRQVRDELKVMSSQQPIFTTIRDGKPFKMSFRNKAEMSIRYEANLEDVKRLKDEGVDLVWISSHVDCSARCQPWQGKLYSISGKNAGKTIDGNKVYKLEDALKGKNNDGNGCINGYNCRHYLIEYKKGSVAPKEYDRALIKKEREVNTQQRLKENQIRQIKTQEVLARESGDKELAKKLNAKWHKLEKKYEIYSLENGRPYYPWRTRLTRSEREQL